MFARIPSSPGGFTVLPRQTASPHMASPWLFIGPEVIYWAIRNVSEIWKPRDIYITENGCSSEDVVAADGHIEDTDRVMYLRNHLTHLHRAASEGYPIRGYFALEPARATSNGPTDTASVLRIHYVDFKTQKRTPKLQRGLVPASHFEQRRWLIERNESNPLTRLEARAMILLV